MIGSSENRISYNGNGIATEFAYNFIILEKSDIKVLHVAADGTEQLLTKDYYVDMEKSVVLYPGYAPGAEIPEQNRPPILPVGERLVIYREVPITQESALDKHWPFNVVENGLDKLTIICQQIWDRLQRSFYVSESTSTNFDPKVPIEAGKTFRVKDDGTGFEVTEDPGKVIDGATALLKQTTEQAESANEAAANAQNAATHAEVQADSVKKYKALWFDSVAAMKAEPSLTAGAYVCTAGYYTPNDGGGASYLIRAKAETDVDDGGSIHKLENGLVAELIVENGTVCPEQFGAKGDGVTDDTEAIKKSFSHNGIVSLNEKPYLFSEPLLIDVDNMTLRGVSSKSILLASQLIQENSTCLTFYSPNGTYYNRINRSRKHGNFTLKSQLLNNNYNVIHNGIKVGGDVKAAGSIECCEFENIRIDGFIKGMQLGANIYTVSFNNINFNAVVYTLYSESNENSGECITFNDCQLWAGMLHLEHQVFFNNCTFHFEIGEQIVNDIQCVHYIGNQFVAFDGCHFEGMTNGTNYITHTLIYTYNAIVKLVNCEGVASLEYGIECLSNAFLEQNDTTKSIHSGIIIDGCWFKYLFGRIKSNYPLCKGKIKITNTPYKYAYDGVNIPKIYNSTTFIKPSVLTGHFDYEYLGENANIEVAYQIVDEGLTVNVTAPEYTKSNIIRLLNVYKLNNCKAINLILNTVCDRGGILTSVDTLNSMWVFLDKDKNIVSSIKDDANKTLTPSGSSIEKIYTIGVPVDAEYIMFGLAFYTGELNASLSCNVICKNAVEFI